MNLDEKIARSIDHKMEEMAQLFNDCDDDAGEVLGLLRHVCDQIPLLEDIKTEVKQLQNSLPTAVEDSKPEEPEDDPAHDPSPSDPELPDLRQAVRDAMKGIDKAKRLSSPLRKALPSSEDPIPDWVKDTDWYDIASDIYKIYKIFKLEKDMKDQYGTLWSQIKELMDGQKTWDEFWKSQEDQSFQALNELMDIINSDLEDVIQDVFQIGEKVDTCCRNMSSTMDDAVDTVLSSDAGLSSAIMNNSLRGWL